MLMKRWFVIGLLNVAFLQIVACKNQSAEQMSQVSEAVPRTYSYSEYVNDCEKEVGQIPAFSCLDGVEIPVYKSGSGPVTHENHSGMAQTCDSPTYIRTDNVAWLIGANHCVPGTRIGQLKPAAGFENDVQMVFICRRYFPRNQRNFRDKSGMVKFEAKNTFDDANVIVHNTKTGGTCFFVNGINRSAPSGLVDFGFYGGQVPRIGSTEGSSFWQSPEEMKVTATFNGVSACTKCHDNDPFIHIPYNHNVKLRDGRPAVPSDPLGPYYQIGAWYFTRSEGTVTTMEAWPTLAHLTSPQAETCTTCHRIGQQGTCEWMAELSSGQQTSKFVNPQFKNTRWMPPADGEKWHPMPIGGDEQRQIDDAVKFIRDCCADTTRTGCQWEPLRRYGNYAK